MIRTRLIGAGIGTVLGLALGTAWWFVWGCRYCAPGASPLAPLVMSVVSGALLGLWLGGDPPPR